MSTLTHGSDLRLAPTLGPIAQAMRSPKLAIERIAKLGMSAIQLDAALPGLRPRELDRTARRDLAATLRRSGLTLAGIDLLIPPDHFREAEHLDRAAAAALAALELAADLGRVPLTLSLPGPDSDAELVDVLIQGSDQFGVPVVALSDQPIDALIAWRNGIDSSLVTCTIDPAQRLTSRSDPAECIQALGSGFGVARLADARRGLADSRCVLGDGDLDLLSYRVSVDLAASALGPVVLDLRQLTSPEIAATTANSRWQGSMR